MSRKTALSHDDLVARAVDEAERLARIGGLSAISVRAIAKAALCSPGTLYNVIGDFDDLILRLNARTTDRITARLSEAVARDGDPKERIYLLADAYIASGEAEAGTWSVLFDYSFPKTRELPQWYAEKLAEPVAVVHAAVRPAFREEEACAAFVARLWASLHGVVTLSLKDKLSFLSDEAPRAFTRSLVDVHIRAEGL